MQPRSEIGCFTGIRTSLNHLSAKKGGVLLQEKRKDSKELSVHA
jgi:hypothetical protein